VVRPANVPPPLPLGHPCSGTAECAGGLLCGTDFPDTEHVDLGAAGGFAILVGTGITNAEVVTLKIHTSVDDPFKMTFAAIVSVPGNP
jgi:hypothetical protein